MDRTCSKNERIVLILSKVHVFLVICIGWLLTFLFSLCIYLFLLHFTNKIMSLNVPLILRHCKFRFIWTEGRNHGWCAAESRAECGVVHIIMTPIHTFYNSSFAYLTSHLGGIVVYRWPVDNPLIREILCKPHIGSLNYFIIGLLCV